MDNRQPVFSGLPLVPPNDAENLSTLLPEGDYHDDAVSKPPSSLLLTSSSSVVPSNSHLQVVTEKCASCSAAWDEFRYRLAFLGKPLLPKCPYDLLPDPVFRFVKFAVVVCLEFLVGYYFVRAFDVNHDVNYTWSIVRQLDLSPMIGDMTIYYFVGELYGDSFQGADTLGWILTVTISMLFLAFYELDPNHLRGTISLYAIHCVWSPALFFAVSVALIFVFLLVFMHLYRAFVDNTIIPKFSKLTLGILVYVAPLITNPGLHIHHWWWSWVLGMHANQHRYWWSTMSSGMLLGLYLNGVSTYGRDPLLGCSEALYRSETFGCSYIRCYLESLVATPSPTPQGGTAAPTYAPFYEPDWKNCSDSRNKYAQPP